MGYLEQYRGVSNPDFRGRVMLCVRKAAKMIIAEDPATPFHQTRKDLADLAVRARTGNEPVVLEFVFRMADNATIGANFGADGANTSTDSDIEYVVASEWDDVADKGLR